MRRTDTRVDVAAVLGYTGLSVAGDYSIANGYSPLIVVPTVYPVGMGGPVLEPAAMVIPIVVYRHLVIVTVVADGAMVAATVVNTWNVDPVGSFVMGSFVAWHTSVTSDDYSTSAYIA